ncbi:hypothetical protein SAMD00019534_023420 [Acytostelium subglobosum LB1]|uniref:hypothetical protein n=1 Tax=Acytostelium subglobosum LB1 TaxID=1410327 RepID=UPI000644F918|nr:hypothetical protein SAMD00019534_023420 [Acytostelium subglobosum LB1]GAM19167.1 hypothetical protein SAMD00019534_023420 [Acytostelium subglobosum LB1]|eukprot:XP_012757094.1 hypothetical protein SAMD00019534_023420 [Acytostelium subglobosum LB1]
MIGHCIGRDVIESLDFLIQWAMKVSGKINTHKLIDIIDLNDCNTPSTLAHIMDKGYLSNNNGDDDKPYILSELVNRACRSGRIDLMQVVHQRCTTPSQFQRHLPTVDSMIAASKRNNHQMLSYLFEGDDAPINRANLQLNMATLINTIRHHSIDNGHLNIINMCDCL